MNKGEAVSFTVQITSVKNATWQGSITSDGESYSFESEIQLLKWLIQKYPELLPGKDES